MGYKTCLEFLNSSIVVSLNFKNPPASNCFSARRKRGKHPDLVFNQHNVLLSSNFDPFAFKRCLHCFSISYILITVIRLITLPLRDRGKTLLPMASMFSEETTSTGEGVRSVSKSFNVSVGKTKTEDFSR